MSPLQNASLTKDDCPFRAAGADTYNHDDFVAIARITHEASGIVLPDGKAMLVYSRLSRRLRECGIARFADYVALIARDAEERLRAVTLLTTNHTMFFREGHHFQHFARDVREDMIERLFDGDRVRMWSAGSSSGEEVYSLAMTLLGSDRREGRRIAESDVAILASDLSDDVIAAGAAGRYPADCMTAIPDRLGAAWMQTQGSAAEMGPELRDLVRFRRLNLLGPWPFAGPFEVIFCRNVMIYFDEPTKIKLLARFADVLADDGYLYIGHSERLIGPAAQQFSLVGNTIYRKDRL
jgi:chemotaxis protein methyltransferase CheR